MLFVLGSILAGVLLHGYFVDDKVAAPQSMKEDAKAGSSPRLWLVGRSVIYHIKSGKGEINLPPCRLMAVELGPSTDPNKATLQIMVNKSVESKAKPVTNIESEAKYVKLTPTQYHTSIVLKTKKATRVPITTYYSS